MDWCDPIVLASVLAIIVLIGILIIYMTSKNSASKKSSFVMTNDGDASYTVTVQSKGIIGDDIAQTYNYSPDTNSTYVSADNKYIIFFVNGYSYGLLYSMSDLNATGSFPVFPNHNGRPATPLTARVSLPANKKVHPMLTSGERPIANLFSVWSSVPIYNGN